MWVLITTEVLELERVASGVDISDFPSQDIYWASPEALEELHKLIVARSDSQYSHSFTAWAFFLSRFVDACRELPSVPDAYIQFYNSIAPPVDRSYSKDRPPAFVAMVNVCMTQSAGLFELLLTLITNSPLFVTAAAWRTGSTVTDPNAVAFRSVLKGLFKHFLACSML